MRIRTRQQVHGRTSGGHIYSAGEGTESVIDDQNQDMVDLIRLMASRGQVEILEDVAAETVDDDDQDDAETTPARDPEPAKTTAAAKTAAKKTTTARRSNGAK